MGSRRFVFAYITRLLSAHTRHTHATMNNNFWTFLVPIYCLFQVICLAPPIKNSMHPICRRMLKIQYIVVPAISITFSFLCIYDFYIFQLPNDFTNRSVIILLLIASTVITFESLFTQSNHLRIIQILCRWDRIYQESFYVFIDYDKQKLKYSIKIYGTILGVGFCYLTGCYIYYTINSHETIGILCLITMAKMTIHTKLIQNGFYMDMVAERLQMINVILEHIKGAPLSSSPSNVLLNTVPLLYGHLWEIIKEIDLSFGWSVMANVIQNVIDLVNDLNILYSNIVGVYSHGATFGKCINAGENNARLIRALFLKCYRCISV